MQETETQLCLYYFSDEPSSHLKATPEKKKVSHGKQNIADNLSPGKRQTGINQFFTASTSHHASHPAAQTSTSGSVSNAPSAANKETDDTMCGVSADEWDDEVMEELNTLADVDWDDDSFDSQPDRKKAKT